MWWYNILGDNKEIMSHIIRLYPINVGYILLDVKLVELERENYDYILIVKRTEWSKFIDYFSLIIEADPSKVGKKNIHFVFIWFMTINSSVNPHISRQHLYKQFSPKLCLYQQTKHIASKITPHVSSTLRDIGLIFGKSIWYIIPMLEGKYCAGNLYLCYGTQNEE